MQLYRLTLSGIGPFAAQQEIDFTKLTQDGLFLLTGQTKILKCSDRILGNTLTFFVKKT